MKRLFSFLSKFRLCKGGFAAVESALITPVLVFGSLVVADLGLAGAQKIDMEQSLRAGAQISMLNVTDTDEIANYTARSLGLSENGSFGEDGLCEVNMTCVSAAYHCECETGIAAACNQLCPATEEPPATFVILTAARQRDAILMDNGNIFSQLVVQTR